MVTGRADLAKVRWRSDLDDGRDDHRAAAVGVGDPAADDPADGLGELVRVGDALGAGRSQLGPISGSTGVERVRVVGEAAPGLRGAPSTLPVTESTTTVIEMKPSSPRIRRSFSDASPTSPTASPSTYT